MNQDQAALMEEQLKHALDLMQAEIDALRVVQNHDREMNSIRLKALEGRVEDHEGRIRSATDGVTQFKVFSGLASGGSGLVSLVALLRSFFGG